jgi:hypothetical protein
MDNIISNRNYIIWDIKNDCPKYDIVYDELKLMTLFNRGFELSLNDKIVNVTTLSEDWKSVIKNFIFNY